MNTSQRVFLDASFLMEIIMARQKQTVCIKVLKGIRGTYFVSALTPHICYYFREKYKLDRAPIDNLLADLGVLPIDQSMVRVAQNRYDGKDFEDCLQAACAEAGGCAEILTLDKNFQNNSGTKLKVRVV